LSVSKLANRIEQREAMVARLESRLWDVADIVKLTEDWEDSI
jgi:hypothetical protein